MSEKILGFVISALVIGGATTLSAGNARSAETLFAPTITTDIVLDGNADDWADVPGKTIALEGDGDVDSVEMKWAVKGDMVYMLAIWDDSSENILHKPYKWSEADKAYAKTKEKEDRFAVSLAMTGDFTANKLDGTAYTTDVWHWKASRSNPVGLAHDKWWKLSTEPFEKGEEMEIGGGKVIYMARMSDKGDKLYKSLKFDAKQDEVMSRYKVNENAQGSIADIKAKGVWRDGKWTLEMARKLDTGNADDAVVPANGEIKIAVAAFNNVDGEDHSVSGPIVLRTDTLGN